MRSAAPRFRRRNRSGRPQIVDGGILPESHVAPPLGSANGSGITVVDSRKPMQR